MTKFEASELGNGALGPLIEISISLEDYEPKGTGFALVDSGADITVLPFEVLIPVGVKWDNLPPSPHGSQGLGGSVETRHINGTISHKGTTFYNGDIPVLQPGSGISGPILGRADFFTTFGVVFEWHKDPPVFHVNSLEKRKSLRGRRKRRM